MLERELFADDPESLAALHDVLLVDGLRHQLRAVLYDGRTFLGYCGAYSEVGQPDYDLEDRAVMQALVEPLRDVLWSERVIGGGRDGRSEVGEVLDAFDTPALVVTPRGGIAYANRAARRATSSCADLRTGPSTRRSRILLDGRPHDLLVLHPGACGGQPDPPSLLPSLMRVATLLSRGLADKEIAEETDLSLATVRTYVSRVYRRLGVRSRRELMRRFGDRGADPC